MDWPTARTALQTVLGTVEVTAPPAVTAETVKRVYKYPPEQIQDEPCIVLEGSSLEEEWSAGTARELYDLNAVFLLRDEDVDSAIQDLEAFRGAIARKLRDYPTLSGEVQVIDGVSFEGEQLFAYAGKNFAGFRFRMPIVISGPYELEPARDRREGLMAANKKTSPTRWFVREGLEPLPGVGPGPMTEAEFKAACAVYMEQFPKLAANTVRNSGIYERRPYEPPERLEVPPDGTTAEVSGDGNGEALPPIESEE